MADEIVMNLAVYVRNGALIDQFAPGQMLIDQDVPAQGGFVQEISVAEMDIDFGLGTIDYSDGAILVLRNLDNSADNYVDVGPDNSGVMVLSDRLYPGMAAIHILAPDVTYRAAATTGPAQLYVRLWPFVANTGTV